VAEYLNINESTLYRKINGTSEFSRDEIQNICVFLKLDSPLEIFLQNNLRKRKKRKADKMNIPGYMTQQEREAYRIGYGRGRQEGLAKASLLIQLVASDSNAFKESILQNSKEAVELRKIFTEKGE